jgi:hypothetical protein
MYALCKLYGVLMLITRFVLCWHLWLSLVAPLVGGDIMTLDVQPPTSPLYSITFPPRSVVVC